MPTDVARVVLYGIATAGCIAWAAGLLFLLASARPRRAVIDDLGTLSAESGQARAAWQTGSIEVEGQPGILASRAARTLARGDFQGIGPVKIIEKTDTHLVLERAGQELAQRPANHWYRRAELWFTAQGSGRTRVDWAVEPRSAGWVLWLGGGFLIAGLLALVIGFWAIDTYVVSSAEPGLRWQTIQMVQAVHFLWPPFLFGVLYRRMTRGAAAALATLANNLPYLAD